MNLFQDYAQPETIDEAVKILSEAPENSAVLAGGTDLLLDIRQGRHPEVDLLVDISAVKEMGEITLEEGWIFLGAGATHKQIITSPLIQENAQCVVEGCGLIGGPQVRNVATIGGNVAHALPAGDGTVALLALDTEVQLASREGTRWLPLIEIFAGPGRVTFDRGQELVVGFRFQEKAEGEASAFHRVMRPQGVAIAILNISAWVKVVEERFADIRISCGPAGPKPFRGYETEGFIRGKALDDNFFSEASRILGEEVSLRTSAHRATKEYRHQLLPVLLKQVLETAVSRSMNRPYHIEDVNHE
ncbi:MAG: FAD binding domain-containing protein [Anaerolineales bacterium]|nr:FAD binding domain-containing protein [Anaerolineales bacterium]